MKIIALLAVTAIFLVDMFGSKSSVGGPMTYLLVSLVAILAVGLHQGWGRGPVGWVVNVVLALIGGVAALSLAGTGLEMAMSALHFEGRLATSDHPLRYLADVAIPIATTSGAWLATQVARVRVFAY